MTALLQRTLKTYALWKMFSKCVKFGTKSTHFNFFFQSALISAILAHSELLILKMNLKCFIDNSINCTFIVKVVKLYYIAGIKVVKTISAKRFVSCKLKQFLHRFCQHFYPILCTGNSCLPLPDIFEHKFVKIKMLFLSCFRKTFGG